MVKINLQMAEFLSGAVVGGGPGGWVEWRPVAYTSGERSIEASTAAKLYDLQDATPSDGGHSLLKDFFTDNAAQALNISFGVPEDGFYSASYYNAW
jgi:hypothetical protein